MSVMENKEWRLWSGGSQELQLMSALSNGLLKSSEMQGTSRDVDSACLLCEDSGISTRYMNAFYFACNEISSVAVSLGCRNEWSETGWAQEIRPLFFTFLDPDLKRWCAEPCFPWRLRAKESFLASPPQWLPTTSRFWCNPRSLPGSSHQTLPECLSPYLHLNSLPSTTSVAESRVASQKPDGIWNMPVSR